MHSSRMHTTHSSSHWGVCLSAFWDRPPWVWAWRPPRCGPGDPAPQVWAWRPPWPDPPQLPPGCGPGNLQGMLEYHPPRDLLQGMLGYHLQCMLGYHHPLVNRMTDRCKNITLPQTSFAGSNKCMSTDNIMTMSIVCSRGCNGRVGEGQRNMKSMRPPLVDIFFYDLFLQDWGGHGPTTPWIRYLSVNGNTRASSRHGLAPLRVSDLGTIVT